MGKQEVISRPGDAGDEQGTGTAIRQFRGHGCARGSNFLIAEVQSRRREIDGWSLNGLSDYRSGVWIEVAVTGVSRCDLMLARCAERRGEDGLAIGQRGGTERVRAMRKGNLAAGEWLAFHAGGHGGRESHVLLKCGRIGRVRGGEECAAGVEIDGDAAHASDGEVGCSVSVEVSGGCRDRFVYCGVVNRRLA